MLHAILALIVLVDVSLCGGYGRGFYNSYAQGDGYSSSNSYANGADYQNTNYASPPAYSGRSEQQYVTRDLLRDDGYDPYGYLRGGSYAFGPRQPATAYTPKQDPSAYDTPYAASSSYAGRTSYVRPDSYGVGYAGNGGGGYGDEEAAAYALYRAVYRKAIAQAMQDAARYARPASTTGYRRNPASEYGIYIPGGGYARSPYAKGYPLPDVTSSYVSPTPSPAYKVGNREGVVGYYDPKITKAPVAATPAPPVAVTVPTKTSSYSDTVVTSSGYDAAPPISTTSVPIASNAASYSIDDKPKIEAAVSDAEVRDLAQGLKDAGINRKH